MQQQPVATTLLRCPQDEHINSLTFVDHDRDVTLVSSQANGVVHLWDLETRRVRCSLQVFEDGTSVLQSLVHGDRLYTQGRNGVVRVWVFPWSSKEDGQLVDEFVTGDRGFCKSLLVESYGGCWVHVDAVDSSRVNVCELVTFQVKHTLSPPITGTFGMCMALQAQTLSVQGEDVVFVFALYESGDCCCWSLKDPTTCVSSCKLHQDVGLSLAVVRDRKKPHKCVAFSGAADEVVNLFTFDGNKREMKVFPEAIRLPQRGTAQIEVRSDQKIFATTGWDGNTRVYNLKSLELLAVFQESFKSSSSLAFSPDRRCLATGSTDGRIAIRQVYPPAQSSIT